MTILKSIEDEVYSYKNEEKAKVLSKYFQAFDGGYGQGDIFLGISVPTLRKIASKYYKKCDLEILSKLISNEIHEYRNLTLMILDKINIDITAKVDFYMQYLEYINNWDLIDASAPNILGSYLFSLDDEERKEILLPLIISENIWHKRIAMMSTFYFIKKNDFELALKVAELLISEKHPMVQKAVGWMLREIGKRNIEIEKTFLDKNIKEILSITFQYSIEKFSKEDKEYYKNLRKKDKL